jgi:conjugal transfer/entry exclusion protein
MNTEVDFTLTKCERELLRKALGAFVPHLSSLLDDAQGNDKRVAAIDDLWRRSFDMIDRLKSVDDLD